MKTKVHDVSSQRCTVVNITRPCFLVNVSSESGFYTKTGGQH